MLVGLEDLIGIIQGIISIVTPNYPVTRFFFSNSCITLKLMSTKHLISYFYLIIFMTNIL